jgi:hypothetical protein
MCECFLSEHTLCALSAVPSNEFPAASFILSFSHQQKVVIIYSARIFFTHRHAASQNHHSTSNQQKPLLTSILKYFLTKRECRTSVQISLCKLSRGPFQKRSIWGKILFVYCTGVLWECSAALEFAAAARSEDYVPSTSCLLLLQAVKIDLASSR